MWATTLKQKNLQKLNSYLSALASKQTGYFWNYKFVPLLIPKMASQSITWAAMTDITDSVKGRHKCKPGLGNHKSFRGSLILMPY